MLRITYAAASFHSLLPAAALTIIVAFAPTTNQSSAQAAWPQWGQNPQHTGFLPIAGQSPQAKLSDQIFDPFTAQEMAESKGALLMHYQIFYAQITSSNPPPHYNVYSVDNCTGAELVYQGTLTAKSNETGITGITQDMAGGGGVTAQCFHGTHTQ